MLFNPQMARFDTGRDEKGGREMMLRVANSRSDDTGAMRALTGYLAANDDPGVRQRPDDMLRIAIDTGLALVVDDDASNIQACSLIYRFDSDEVYSEIGTQRVTLNGRGLQVFMASLQLVQLKLELDDDIVTTFAVVSPGSASEHNLVDLVGMSAWDPPRHLVEARAVAGVPFMDGKRVIRADCSAVASAFSAMRRWHVGGNVFRCPKSDDELRVDCGWFDPAILEIG
jgi:hypothetical protein